MNRQQYYISTHSFLLLFFVFCCCCCPAAAFQIQARAISPPPPTSLFLFSRSSKFDGDSAAQSEIRALFLLWNDALATGDARIVTRRYAEDAVLFPIDSDIPRMDLDSIQTYYDSFLIKRPQVFHIQSQIKMGKGWAQDSYVLMCVRVCFAESYSHDAHPFAFHNNNDTVVFMN